MNERIYLHTGDGDSAVLVRNSDSLQWENGLAVAKVEVHERQVHCEICYYSYVVISEKKDVEGNYQIVQMKDYSMIPHVKEMEQFGNNFFYRIPENMGNNTSVDKYYHYKFNEETETLEMIREVPGMPQKTMNPDIVIISNRLYSLSKEEFTSRKYSSIEGNDGETFFVCDVVKNSDKTLTDHLLFNIDANGERKSEVYSRNQRDALKNTSNMPYENIVELVQNELNITARSEEIRRAYLLRKQDKEQ